MCPPEVIFNALKALLNDFVHHNVDVTCMITIPTYNFFKFGQSVIYAALGAALETCGHYLYMNPETHQRANLLVRQSDMFVP